MAKHPHVRKTGLQAENERGERYPLYEGTAGIDHAMLEDGTLVHIYFGADEPYGILCRELVAYDSGENEVFSLQAKFYEWPSTVRNKNLTLVPREESIVGYYFGR